MDGSWWISSDLSYTLMTKKMFVETKFVPLCSLLLLFFTCFYDVVKKIISIPQDKCMQRVCIFKFWLMATHSCLTGAPSCSQFVGFCLSSCFLKTNKTKNIPKTKVFQRSRCNLRAKGGSEMIKLTFCIYGKETPQIRSYTVNCSKARGENILKIS